MAPVEPWAKVFINLGNYDEFSAKDVNHGSIPCESCHGTGAVSFPSDGEYINHTNEFDNFIPDPSKNPSVGCGTELCHDSNEQSDEHQAIVVDFQYSLHFILYGEQNQLALREGVDSFAECPVAIQDGHTGECTSCHATCGDCHIARPNTVGGGLINSHIFQGTPSQTDNCQACHGSRITVDFEGHIETDSTENMIYNNQPNYHNEPDVHGEMGMGCLTCHNGEEMHAAIPEEKRSTVSRYNYDLAPSCEDCHTDLSGGGLYHTMHAKGGFITELQCQVCHSQPYDNCASCHVDGEWKIETEYQTRNPYYGFRIAQNPIKDDDKRTEDYVVVRHAPVAPDSYDNWGTSIGDFNALPTWKYATPHNIIRWTPQTDTTGTSACSDNCHVLADGRNSQLFLTESFLDEDSPDEKNANLPFVMDGKFGGLLK